MKLFLESIRVVLRAARPGTPAFPLALALAALASAAIAQDTLVGQSARGFRYPEYDSQGHLKMELSGDRARVLPKGLIEITGLRMTFYEQGKTVMQVTTPFCVYDRASGGASSTSAVSITRAELIITGRGFNLDEKNERIQINNDVRVVLRKSGGQSFIEEAR